MVKIINAKIIKYISFLLKLYTYKQVSINKHKYKYIKLYRIDYSACDNKNKKVKLQNRMFKKINNRNIQDIIGKRN